MRFEIQKERVQRFLITRAALLMMVPFLPALFIVFNGVEIIFGFFLLAAVVVCFFIIMLDIHSLTYTLGERSINARLGQRVIDVPLKNISRVELHTGPLMSLFNIKGIKVYVGSQSKKPAVVLWGIVDVDKAIAQILMASST